MKHVLIDGQTTVEINPTIQTDIDEERAIVLTFTETHNILDAWSKLAPSRRSFRYGNDADDTEPAKIFVAEALRNNTGAPVLALEEVAPFWTAGENINAYDLEHLHAALGGSDALQWGTDIGEEEI